MLLIKEKILQINICQLPKLSLLNTEITIKAKEKVIYFENPRRGMKKVLVNMLSNQKFSPRNERTPL